MTEIDDLLKEIQEMQETLSRDIAGLDKKDPSQRSLHLNKCQNKLILLRTRIEAYGLETLQLDRKTQAKHKESLGLLQTKAKELQTELDKRKADKKDISQWAAVEESKKIEEMNTQELIQTGDKYQEEGKRALGRILQNIHSADQKADQTHLELDKHEQKIQRAQEKNQDIQIYIKKIFMWLVFLAIIAVIIIIFILKIVKKDDYYF